MDNEQSDIPVRKSKKNTIRALSERQELFCLNVVKGMLIKEAYRTSYGCENMKEATISAAASNLHHSPRIQARIKEMQFEMQREHKVTVEKVLTELAHIAFDDIKNYVDFRTEKKQVGTDKNGNPIYDYAQVVDIKDSERIDTRSISEVAVDQKGNFKFKLYPKDTALVKLGQYLGLFIDKTELTGKDGGPIEINDARQLLIEKLSKKPHQEGD